MFSSLTYNVNYDVLKDLAPVAMLTMAPMVFVARAGFPPNDLKELLAWFKANPNGASFGAVGVGGPATVWGTDFKIRNNVQFQFVPYRGAAAIMQDLVAGQIDLACTEASNVLPHLRAGKLKAYAVLTKERWPVAPEIPTIDEAFGLHHDVLAWALGAEGHAEGRDRKAQRRGDGRTDRSDGARAHRADGPGDRAAWAADAGGARRAPQGRGREVAAGDQGGRHQGRVNGLGIGGRASRPPATEWE